MKLLLVAGLGMLCCSAWAGESAYTVRATELKAKPFKEAATVSTLAENSKVEIMVRQSSWIQVNSDGGAGWVKMLSLRLDSQNAPSKSGDSGMGSLFNLAKTGRSGSTDSNGVRGLKEENLKNPHPNPEALETMQTYATNKTDAQKFAKTGKLNAQTLEYVASTKGDNQ